MELIEKQPRWGRIKAILVSPRLPVYLVLLALVLSASSLNSGWFMDDLWHREGYVGYSGHAADFAETWNLTDEDRLAGPMQMYAFVDGTPAKVMRLKDMGVFPWWADEALRLSFWRPLAALTHSLDYWLWPALPMLMHLQSSVWFAALALASLFLYRRMMGLVWAAGLAALLYTVDETHATTAGWLANRHALLAALFGVLTLIAHDRWRNNSRSMWPIIPCVLLSLSLLSAEAGIAVLAYLFSYTIFIDRRDLKSKLAALLPYLLCIGVWRIVYSALGYGASESGAYIDPAREPLRFLTAVVERAPIILNGALAWPPSDLYFLIPQSGSPFLLWYSVAVLAGLFFLFRPVLRESRRARFWACAVVLSAIPLCAALPSNRNLSLTGIGVAGLIAEWVSFEFARRGEIPRSRLRSFAVSSVLALFLLVHLGGAALSHFIQPGLLRHFEGDVKRFCEIEVSDLPIAERDVVLVNGAGAFAVGNFLPFRLHADLPAPAHIRTLAYQLGPIEILREDQWTLRVRPESGFYAPPAVSTLEAAATGPMVSTLLPLKYLNRLYRNPAKPMQVGATIESTGVQIEITALTDDGRPSEARFRFEAPLEHPSLLWLQWTGGKYRDFNPPGVGETVIITPLSNKQASNSKGA